MQNLPNSVKPQQVKIQRSVEVDAKHWKITANELNSMEWRKLTLMVIPSKCESVKPDFRDIPATHACRDEIQEGPKLKWMARQTRLQRVDGSHWMRYWMLTPKVVNAPVWYVGIQNYTRTNWSHPTCKISIWLRDSPGHKQQWLFQVCYIGRELTPCRVKTLGRIRI